MFGFRKIAVLLVVLVAGLAGAPEGRAAQLVMFETESCEWCQRWHEVIGPIYPKTPESAFAPLRRIEIADDIPGDLEHLKNIRFTPTFVVIDKGREIGRILGYPGEDFFWGLLGEILKKAGFRQSVAAAAD